MKQINAAPLLPLILPFRFRVISDYVDLDCIPGWHLESGMVGQIVELPKAISTEIHIPQAYVELCGPGPSDY